jgi:hypothetical protein
MVEWCPTGDMIGNFMTKPDQDALFTKFRYQIMGVTPTKNPGPGKNDKRLVKQGKLDHRSVLDGDSKLANNGRDRRRTNRIRAKKNLYSTKKISTAYVQQ